MKEVTMTKKYTIRIGWALFLTSLISTYGVAQESVDVPQLLQKNVHAFKLTIDSLESITTDIKLHTKDVIQDLKAIQKKMKKSFRNIGPGNMPCSGKCKIFVPVLWPRFKSSSIM